MDHLTNTPAYPVTYGQPDSGIESECLHKEKF